MQFIFAIGEPFQPFQQLMAVMPPACAALLPRAYRGLMNDATSPILDFYPLHFESDMNGKKQEWEAVVKIPFIDERRLIEAMTGMCDREFSKSAFTNFCIRSLRERTHRGGEVA